MRSQGDEPGLAAAAGFAERLLEVIDSGRRTATYKLALVMALLDLCARRGDADGYPPSVLYTREIAERVAVIYWPQVMAYRRGPQAIQLRQITLPRSAIIEAVLEFRRVAEANGIASLGLACQRLAREYSQMLDRVEIAVAEQPLPRLQIVGSGEQALPFLYDIGWGPRESFSVRRLHRDHPAGLPVRLRPGAGDHLVRLAPLIRPWSSCTGPGWSPRSTMSRPKSRAFTATFSAGTGSSRPRSCAAVWLSPGTGQG